MGLVVALLGVCLAQANAMSSSTGQASLIGVSISTGLGAADAGTQRVATSSDSALSVSGSSVTTFQGGPWNVGQSGSYTVTPGTGIWNTSTNVLISSVIAVQGGIYTVTPGTGTFLVSVAPSPGKVTYSASALGVVVSLLPTDVFTITGSATRTVKVRKVSVTGTSTGGVVRDVLLIKRSSANSGGTSTDETEVVLDSSDPAATATILSYTANPTLGGTVGRISSTKLAFPLPGGAVNPGEIIYESREIDSIVKPITLRGASEVLAVNLNGVTITGSSVDFWLEWTEEN